MKRWAITASDALQQDLAGLPLVASSIPQHNIEEWFPKPNRWTVDLTVNGKPFSADVEPDMPLLWVLRDIAGLKGTKYGCGVGACGACTVLMGGSPVRSCSIPVSAASNPINTIEGLSQDGHLHAVQEAWIEEQVPQCGYCQSGQILSAVALLTEKPQPTDGDIAARLAGNLCRCGTYSRIRKAIHRAAEMMA